MYQEVKSFNAPKLPTYHDKRHMRFLSENHPDASENTHCLYGSVKNIESILNY